MSITLECRKTKSEMEIGYGNFFFLRAKVAELFDKNVWQQYMKIMEIPYGDDRKQALEKWDTDMDRILQASEMPSGVKDSCSSQIVLGISPEVLVWHCMSEYTTMTITSPMGFGL